MIKKVVDPWPTYIDDVAVWEDVNASLFYIRLLDSTYQLDKKELEDLRGRIHGVIGYGFKQLQR